MRYDLTVRTIHSEEMTLEHLATRADMHPAIVRRLADLGLIQPVSVRETLFVFESSTIPRLRSIKRLRSELGINLQGVAVVLDLVERLRGLEQEIASLRARL